MPTLREAEQRHARYYAQLLTRLQDMYQAGVYEPAVKSFEEEWSQLRKGQAWAYSELDRGDEGLRLFVRYAWFGRDLLQLRRPPSEFIRWLDPALPLISELGNHRMMAELLNVRVVAAFNEANFADAEAFSNRALAELVQVDPAGDDGEFIAKMQGAMLRNLAAVCQRTGRFEEAVDRSEQSLAVARDRGDRAEEGSLLGNLGITYAEHGDDERAITYYQQAADIADEVDDEIQREMWLGNMGNSLVSLGRLEEGAKNLEQALSMARRSGDRAREGMRLGGLAAVYRELDRPEHARECSEQALAIAREMGSAYSEATQLHQLGLLHLAAGRGDEAAACFTQAAERFAALGLESRADISAMGARTAREDRADALFDLGLEHQNQQRFPEAIDAYTRSLEISRQLDDPRRESQLLGNLGFAEQQAGHLDIAERHLLKVIEIDAGLADVTMSARHMLNLANLHQLRRDLDAARQRYDEVLALPGLSMDGEEAANAHANLGALDDHLGRLAAAREHYRRASEAFAALGMTESAEWTRRNLARLDIGPAMDERTASDLGLFLVNQHVSGDLAGLTIVTVDGAATPARLAGVELGPGLPRITVALPDGRSGNLDFFKVSAVTVHLADGGERHFGPTEPSRRTDSSAYGRLRR